VGSNAQSFGRRRRVYPKAGVKAGELEIICVQRCY